MRDTWKKRTKAVHAGTRRSGYGEMSEAVFLTQGFAYDTAASAEARPWSRSARTTCAPSAR